MLVDMQKWGKTRGKMENLGKKRETKPCSYKNIILKINKIVDILEKSFVRIKKGCIFAPTVSTTLPT